MDRLNATVEKNKNGGLIRKQRKEDGYMIEQIVAYNKKFVEEKGYEPYLTSKYPDKKLAILTCMDTRLIELLPAALGIRNGDAKVIKNAGDHASLRKCDAKSSGCNCGTWCRGSHGNRSYRLRRTGNERHRITGRSDKAWSETRTYRYHTTQRSRS